MNGQSINAITFTVKEKETVEIPPYKEYITTIINAAKNYQEDSKKFSTYYINFLEYLASERNDNFRKGFLVEGTYSRKESQGINLIKLPVCLKGNYPEKFFCLVEYRNKICPAKVAYSKDIEKNTCQLDQTIREALGIKGTELYGHHVKLFSSNEKINRFPIIRPTILIFPLEKASINDSEKKICVLNKRSFKLLGIEEGDYLIITTVIKNKNNVPKLSRISRRAFSGTAETVLKSGLIQEKYPKPKLFYLDLDGRLELRLKPNEIEVPVIIYPDLLKLFYRHLWSYGTTLFLGLLVIPSLIQELGKIFCLSPSRGFLIGLLLAILSSILLTVLDLRSRVQY